MKKFFSLVLSLLLLVSFASCGTSSNAKSEPSREAMMDLVPILADSLHSRQEIKDAMIEAGASEENAESYISNFGYSWESIAMRIADTAYKAGEIKDKDEAKVLLEERKFTQEEIAHAVDKNDFIPTKQAREAKEKLSNSLNNNDNEKQNVVVATGSEPKQNSEQKPASNDSKPKKEIDYKSLVVGTWEGYLENIGVETELDFQKRDNANVTMTFNNGVCVLAGFAKGFSYDYDVYGSGTYTINSNELSYSLALNYSNYDEDRFSTTPQTCTRTLVINAEQETMGNPLFSGLTKKSNDVAVLEASTLTKTHEKPVFDFKLNLPSFPVNVTYQTLQTHYHIYKNFHGDTLGVADYSATVMGLDVETQSREYQDENGNWVQNTAVDIRIKGFTNITRHLYYPECGDYEGFSGDFANMPEVAYIVCDPNGVEVYRGVVDDSTHAYFNIPSVSGIYTLKFIHCTRNLDTKQYSY